MNSQATTFLVRQASAMDRHITPHFEYPSASLGLFAISALYIFIPIYEKLLVPVMRRITGIEQGITTLQRVGVGALLGVLAMVVSALVESKRLLIVRANVMTLIFMPSKPLPMSVFWLCPQIIFIGLSECFTLIGLNEFYYRETPQGMRTMGAAFNMSAQGLGSYGSSLLVLLVIKATTKGLNTGWLTDDLDESRLDYFYWLLAVLGVLNFTMFLVCARWYRYKLLHEQVEELPEIGVKSNGLSCNWTKLHCLQTHNSCAQDDIKLSIFTGNKKQLEQAWFWNPDNNQSRRLILKPGKHSEAGTWFSNPANMGYNG